MLRIKSLALPVFATLLLAAGPALADKYSDALKMFQDAGESAVLLQDELCLCALPDDRQGWTRRRWRAG